MDLVKTQKDLCLIYQNAQSVQSEINSDFWGQASSAFWKQACQDAARFGAISGHELSLCEDSIPRSRDTTCLNILCGALDYKVHTIYSEVFSVQPVDAAGELVISGPTMVRVKPADIELSSEQALVAKLTKDTYLITPYVQDSITLIGTIHYSTKCSTFGNRSVKLTKTVSAKPYGRLKITGHGVVSKGQPCTLNVLYDEPHKVQVSLDNKVPFDAEDTFTFTPESTTKVTISVITKSGTITQSVQVQVVK